MICKEEQCTKIVHAKGWCKTHYMRQYKTGSPEKKPHGNRQDLATRLLSKIEIQSDGCWMWTAGLNSHGYAKFKIDGKTVAGARLLWFLRHGSLSSSVELDHLCHTRDKDCSGGTTCKHRRCVNPEHLEPCTSAENTARRDARKRLR